MTKVLTPLRAAARRRTRWPKRAERAAYVAAWAGKVGRGARQAGDDGRQAGKGHRWPVGQEALRKGGFSKAEDGR